MLYMTTATAGATYYPASEWDDAHWSLWWNDQASLSFVGTRCQTALVAMLWLATARHGDYEAMSAISRLDWPQAWEDAEQAEHEHQMRTNPYQWDWDDEDEPVRGEGWELIPA